MKNILILSLGFCLAFICCEGKNQSTTQENKLSLTKKIENPKSDSLQYLIREAKGSEPKVLIVLMHGYGANKEDLFPLANYFPENYIVVTPQAPYQIGNSNYQWYTSEKDSNGGFSGKSDELNASISKMEDFITSLQKKYNVAADRTFIGGFSQGANMSYQLGLRDPKQIKGIGVLSGTIFNDLKASKDKDEASDLKIFIGHGDQDNRIPFTEAQASEKWLGNHHYQTEFHTYKGMTHSISEQEILDLVTFVKKNIT